MIGRWYEHERARTGKSDERAPVLGRYEIRVLVRSRAFVVAAFGLHENAPEHIVAQEVLEDVKVGDGLALFVAR